MQARSCSKVASSCVDVVIVGSGFAGLAAALECSKNPSHTVAILEKMSSPGGNSVRNAGQVAALGSRQQHESGVKDTRELMLEDMRKAGQYLNHEALLQKLVDRSNETAEWTTKELGVQYKDRLSHLGGHSVPRTLCTVNTTGRDIIDPMLSKIEQMPNISLSLNTKVTELVTSKGEVEGVKIADVNDKYSEIKCRRGVVLAAGGFSADIPFRSVQNPMFNEKVMTTNQDGATSEVLRAALRIGAMPIQLSWIQLGPWTSPDETGFGRVPFFCLGAGFPYGILVNPKTSRRFVNEMANRFERSRAIFNLGQPAICLTDNNGFQHSLDKDTEAMKPALAVHQSLADLAKHYNLDLPTLRVTLEEYNEGVARRSDAFGKVLRDDLKAIDVPPYFSARLWPKVHHCMGGLHIDEDARVMNLDGAPIPRLFAAGEMAGGVHGADRLGSCATTDCLVFGRVAGESVSKLPARAV